MIKIDTIKIDTIKIGTIKIGTIKIDTIKIKKIPCEAAKTTVEKLKKHLKMVKELSMEFHRQLLCVSFFLKGLIF
jgi:hypothetical protein